MDNEELIQRIADMDEDLASEVRHALLVAEGKARVQRARDRLSEACARAAEDPTGQDGELECERAAQDYIDAQDSNLRATDPERWSEKQMGA